MLKTNIGLSLSCALFLPLIMAPAYAEDAPGLQGSGEARVDMKHVALDLNFDPSVRSVTGSARLDFSLIAPAQMVRFDAVGLKVSKVTDQQGNALAFVADDSGGTKLRVDLGRTYPKGRAASVTVEYTTTWVNETDPGNIWGSVGTGLRFHSPSDTDARRRPQIWSSNAPDSARRWYPGNDTPGDLRTFEVKATVPRTLNVIATGRLVSQSALGTDRVTYHWRSDVPHQNHRSGIAIGDFREVALPVKGGFIRSYGYPDEIDGVQASIERVQDIANWTQAKLGTAIPGDGYNQVFVQELPWTMVSPGLSIATENFVDSKEVHRDFMYLWDDLQSEGIAEQWMGISVAPQNWSDLWLSKGISRYLATLYNEEKNGIAEVQLSQYHVFGDHITLKGIWDSGFRVALSPADVSDPALFASSSIPNIRGNAVMRLLELEVGRPKLLAAIRAFHDKFKGKTATTADFVSVASRATGKDLSLFAAQWITGFGRPVLKAKWQYEAAAKEVIVTIDQAVIENVQSGPFGGRLELEIDGATKTVEMAPVAQNLFRFKLAAEPKYVAVDPASYWIATVQEAWTPQAYIAAAQDSPTPLLRRKAMIALASEAGKTETGSSLREQARDVFRKALASKSYWRLKATATGQLRNLASPATDGKSLVLDPSTTAVLTGVVNGTNRDEAWARFNALTLLGDTRNASLSTLYTSKLRDPSDRIINAAAIALGKSGAPGTFETLVALEPHPSWKNQSRISMLDGLGELGDQRGVQIALDRLLDTKGSRWTLVTPVWDYRLSAAVALKKLGAGRRGYDALLPALETALAARHVSDSFYLANLMLSLGDAEALTAFDRIETVFSTDKPAVDAIKGIRDQLKQQLGQKQ
jgi:aminopeptidase N